MKNYYQLLEIQRTATPQDIKRAYRKLSLQYHPDKNQGQPYFNDLFIQIKEAYEVLSDDIRRKNYDAALDILIRQPHQKEEEFVQPVIDFFYINTNTFKIGDVIEFRWKTHFADTVEIRPFGKVPSEGIKKFRITHAADFIMVELVALNTISRRYAMSSIQINNTSEKQRRPKMTADDQHHYESLNQQFPGVDIRHFQRERLLSIYGRISARDYIGRVLSILFFGYCIAKIGNVHQRTDSMLFVITFGLLFTCLIINTIKRLHDTGQSAQKAVLLFIPVVNIFFILTLCYQKGDAKINRFGVIPNRYQNK